MDALLTEVQLIKIPRPKFCCSKGQLRSTNSKDSSPSITSNGLSSEHQPTSNGHSEPPNINSRQGAPRITNGYNGTRTALSQGMDSHLNGNFYPAEPPKDYFDDDLHIETLAIRSDEELNRANLRRPAGPQATHGSVSQASVGSTTPSTEVSRTNGSIVNGNAETSNSPGNLCNNNNNNNKTKGN